MPDSETNIDRLLKARAKIDEELRQYRSLITILFTDVVGSTEYFDRYGDTAGMGMLHRHSDLGTRTAEEFHGRVIKTIGDSVMAEFSEPALAVRAAVELQRRLLAHNNKLPERERLQLRIGINHGPAIKSGTDVYGDAVNLAARITKDARAAQILVSRTVWTGIASEPSFPCRCVGKITFKGKTEQEEVFEVVWTEAGIYAELQANLTAAAARGDLVLPGAGSEDLSETLVLVSGTNPDSPQGAQILEKALAAIATRYEILSQLGSGGMGVVYKARDRETGEIVALKVIKPEIAALPEVVDRFKAEMRLTRKVTHKSVCRAYELLRFDETVVIAMEYVDGETLRAFLQRYGTAPLRRGLEWMIQIARGLAEAHAQGILHRDLKPENIMIDKLGQAKIMDFGIAHSADQTTAAGMVLGTPAYMSPEQAAGTASAPASDIYALGLVLYEMFTGRPAFSAETSAALALKQIQEPPPPPSSIEPFIPEFLDRAIRKCLERDPLKRFQSAIELEAALAQKPAFERESAGIQLPGHLNSARWSDAILLLLGALGLAGFIWLAPATLPVSGTRIRMPRESLVEKARDEAVHYGWKPVSDPFIETKEDTKPYHFLSERSGHAVANASLGRDFPPFFFQVQFREPHSSTREKLPIAEVLFESDGSIRRLRLPVVGWIPKGNGLPHAEALEKAKQSMQRTLGVDSSQLEVESDSPIDLQGRHGNSFRWVKREPTGIESHYQADVYDRPALLEKSYTLPEDYRPPDRLGFGGYIASGWLILALVFFLVRRMYSKIRRREAAVLVAASVLLSVGFVVTTSEDWSSAVALFIMFTAMIAILLIILTLSLQELVHGRWPYFMETYSALIRLRPVSRPTGLALVRGISLGILIAGLSAMLNRLVLDTRLASTGVSVPTTEINSAFPFLTMLTGSIIGAIAVAYGCGFIFSIARRWITAPLLLVVVGAVSGAVLSFTIPLNWHGLLFGFFTGAFLAVVLIQYDLLTLLAALFTYQWLTMVYILIEIYQTIGNLQYWFGAAILAAGFAWAVFAGFRPLWDRAGRRLAEALR